MFDRTWKGGYLLAVGLALMAGCQHAAPPKTNTLLSADGKGEKAKLTDRETADVQVAMARSLEMRGDSDHALAGYLEAVKRDPRRGDAHLRIAILYDQQGKVKEASPHYEQALKANDRDPAAHCNLGYSLYLQRSWAKSEEHLRRALELAPDYAQAHNNLALVLAHCERSDEAIQEFRRGGCKEAEAHANLAFAFVTENRVNEAHEEYTRALAIDPSLQSARTGLQRLTAAIASAETSKQSRPAGERPVQQAALAPPTR